MDLAANSLSIGTTGTKTLFLGEGDLPEIARLNRSVSATSEEERQLTEAMDRSSQPAGKLISFSLIL